MESSCRCIGFTHTIEKGDTLYQIGKKYQVSVSALIFANPYVDVYNLQVGDEICIPKFRQES
jgi:LysM repeat protein